MIFGARSSGISSGSNTLPIYDSFDGASVNIDLWTLGQWAYSAAPAADYANINIVSGQVELRLQAPYPVGGEGNASCYIRAKAPMATTGMSRVEFVWTPGPKDANSGHFGWVTLSPEGGLRNSIKRPYAYPSIMFGASGDFTGPRTAVYLGKSNSGNGQNPTTAATGKSWELEVGHAVKWLFDWNSGVMSLFIDNAEVLHNVTIGYTPTNDHFLEFGNYGYYNAYNQPGRYERFDDIAFTRV